MKTNGRVRTNPVSAHLNGVLFNPSGWASLKFSPNPRAQTIIARNPALTSDRVGGGRAPVAASFMIGLETGHTVKKKISAGAIRDAVMRWFPTGGSIVLQLGWYAGSQEDSVRVTVENSVTGVSDSKFIATVKKMLEQFVDRFYQNEIWLDIYRSGRLLRGFRTVWVQ